MKKSNLGICLALISALLYSFISPISKLLNDKIPPFFGAAFLYLGTFLIGIIIFGVRFFTKFKDKENKLTKKDVPNLLLASLFHAGATITLLLGLQTISASNASLLTSLEIISTSVFAYFFFKEKISPLMWIGIAFIFAAVVLISLGDLSNLQFNIGVIYCLISPICFGLANNFQKKISNKDPILSTSMMGLFGFVLTIIIALIRQEQLASFGFSAAQVGLGVFSYGISLILFLFAERLIGAAKTSAFFSIYPFLAIIFSLIFFYELPYFTFYIGLGSLSVGYIFVAIDSSRG